MKRKRHTTEQIIAKLRQVEIEMSRGKSVAEAVKVIGVTDQMYYRWPKEYGGLRLDQARRLKHGDATSDHRPISCSVSLDI